MSTHLLVHFIHLRGLDLKAKTVHLKTSSWLWQLELNNISTKSIKKHSWTQICPPTICCIQAFLVNLSLKWPRNTALLWSSVSVGLPWLSESVFVSADEGGGVTGRCGLWFWVFSRPDLLHHHCCRGGVQPRLGWTLHVTAAERGGERAAGRPGEGRPDGEGAEGGAGGRRAMEEVSAHHQRDDRHQEWTVKPGLFLHLRRLWRVVQPKPQNFCCSHPKKNGHDCFLIHHLCG